MFPIILSQARAQSKEAERTGSSIPGKGCTTTLTLGDPNSTQQQASHSKWPDFSALLSLLRAQLSAPSQDWVHSPPARPPPPDTQPTIPGTPPKAHAASRHKTSLEAQSLLSESSPRGVPRAKLPGVHSWRKGSGVGGGSPRGLLRPGGGHLLPAWRCSRGARVSLAAGLGQRATTSHKAPGRLARARHSHPEMPDRTGLPHAGEIATEVAGKGQSWKRQSWRSAGFRGVGTRGLPAVQQPPNR